MYFGVFYMLDSKNLYIQFIVTIFLSINNLFLSFFDVLNYLSAFEFTVFFRSKSDFGKLLR